MRHPVALVVLAAAAGCGPAVVLPPDCPTIQEVSGVYVMDGQGARPCVIPRPRPGPTLRWQDLEFGDRATHTDRLGGGTPTARPQLAPTTRRTAHEQPR